MSAAGTLAMARSTPPVRLIKAKRMAIAEAASYRYPMALLTIMDAAHEHRSLIPIAVQALGDFRNERARP